MFADDAEEQQSLVTLLSAVQISLRILERIELALSGKEVDSGSDEPSYEGS